MIMSLVNMMHSTHYLFEDLLMESRPMNSGYGNPSDSSLWGL